MRVLKFFIPFVFLAAFLSCVKKKYPAPVVTENPAVYYSLLTIDNMLVKLEAGVDNYYMYSSFKLDSNFVFGYTGELKKTDCTDCPNSLKVQINDCKISLTGSISSIDEALHPGRYPILSGNPEASYAVKFDPLNEALSYDWNFGDGNKSDQRSPVHTYTKPGNYNVCLATQSDQGCWSSICNKQKIDVSDKYCKASISAVTTSLSSVKFSSIVNGGKGPYQYLWRFPDGVTSYEKDYTYIHKHIGGFTAMLRVVDANGDTANTSYNAKTNLDNSSCTANYKVTSVTRIPAPAVLSQVIITWTDAVGTVFTSNSSLQPDDSSFEILTVSDNEKNENNLPTKKVEAKFNCKLYNGTRFVTVSDARVVICVAYN